MKNMRPTRACILIASGGGGGTPAVTAALFAPVSGAQVDFTTLLYATPSATQLALISNP